MKIEINISTGKEELDKEIKEKLENILYVWLQDYLGIKIIIRDE